MIDLPVLFEGAFTEVDAIANYHQRAAGLEPSTALITHDHPAIIMINARQICDTCHSDLAKSAYDNRRKAVDRKSVV